MKQILLLFLVTLPLISGTKTSHYKFEGNRITIEEKAARFTYNVFKKQTILSAEFSKTGELVTCESKRNPDGHSVPQNKAKNVQHMIAKLIKLGVPSEDVLHVVYYNKFQTFCLSSSKVRRFRRQANGNGMLIFPGTKWCGKGNIATSPQDLGEEYEADECCRSHDNCGNSIVRRAARFGYTNRSPFTINTCECDENFKSCLQGAGTVAANDIGELFFNRVGMLCYRLRLHRCDSSAYRSKCSPNQLFYKEAYAVQLPRWVSISNDYDDY